MSPHFQSRQQPQQDNDGQRGHQGGKPPMPQGIIDLSPGHTNSSKPEFPISTPRLYTNRLLVSSPDRRGGLAGPSRFVLAVFRKSRRNTSTSERQWNRREVIHQRHRVSIFGEIDGLQIEF